MKSQWTILLVSAFTDFIISFGTAVMAGMVGNGAAVIPPPAVLILAGVGGLVAFGRTVQQALKATPQASAELKGDPIPPLSPKV
jgi:hypothetical protein